jgi:hypothetical protein
MALPWTSAQHAAFSKAANDGDSCVFVGPARSGKSMITWHIERWLRDYKRLKVTCMPDVDWHQWKTDDGTHAFIAETPCLTQVRVPSKLKNKQLIIITREVPSDVRTSLQAAGISFIDFDRIDATPAHRRINGDDSDEDDAGNA